MKLLDDKKSSMHVFDELESEVRSYCRSFPVVFSKAKGYRLWDENGREYIDFFAGAGALNYGHNNPQIREKLLRYLADDGITHSLDMATKAKEQFITRFNEVILTPRGLNYKMMFTGPTGTNAVESALKLARKVSGRDTIMSFTNGFHGMTLGSLAITGNRFKRDGAGVALHHSVVMPFDRYFGDDVDTSDYIERLLEDHGSGIALPAAIILETVQGEGGVNVARYEWLQKIERICRKWDILLIVDDIQAGCGRTGTFFSFEPSGISPDIVCLSKSLGGYGLPIALTLMKAELDVWEPGEHNGTFRGNNLGFVGATEAIRYWEDDQLSKETLRKGERVRRSLEDIAAQHPKVCGEVRGRGLMQGIALNVEGLAEQVCAGAFERGLVIETSGSRSEVVKLLPPLIIDDAGLEQGLSILTESIEASMHALKLRSVVG